MIIRYGLIKKSKWVQNKTKKGLGLNGFESRGKEI